MLCSMYLTKFFFIVNRITSLRLDFINSCYLFIDDSITIEGDLTEQHPCIWCIVDGKLKMKLSFRDQIVLDISINNDANIRGAYLHLPTARVTRKYNWEMIRDIINNLPLFGGNYMHTDMKTQL